MTTPPPRAFYDAMVMLQWAALPPQRQHTTVTALSSGQLRLAMSRQMLEELRDLFFRPELQARLAEYFLLPTVGNPRLSVPSTLLGSYP